MKEDIKKFHVLLMVLIIVSAPTLSIPIVPRPYDWLIKLSVFAIQHILPFFFVYLFFYREKVYLYFTLINLLFIPEAIADSGILWDSILKPLFDIPDTFNYVEKWVDNSLTISHWILNIILFIYTYLDFKKLEQE